VDESLHKAMLTPLKYSQLFTVEQQISELNSSTSYAA